METVTMEDDDTLNDNSLEEAIEEHLDKIKADEKKDCGRDAEVIELDDSTSDVEENSGGLVRESRDVVIPLLESVLDGVLVESEKLRQQTRSLDYNKGLAQLDEIANCNRLLMEEAPSAKTKRAVTTKTGRKESWSHVESLV